MLLILLLLLLCVRIPAVQTKLGQIATQRLSKQLQTKVSVDKIAINFVDNANLKGIYIEDRQEDTLLYARNLNVELGFWKLLSKRVLIEDVSLENAFINLKQGADSSYNFQFLIDAFAADESAEATPSEVELSISTVNAKNLRGKVDLMDGNHALSLNSLFVGFDDVDLQHSVFTLDDFIIDELSLYSEVVLNEEVLSDVNMQTDSTILEFPLASLPFSIYVSKAAIQNSAISYHINDTEEGTYYDFENSDISNLNFEMNDLELDSNHVNAAISRFDFFLNDKFILNELSSEFHFTANAFELNSLELHTGESDVQLQGSVAYENFNDIIANPEELLLDLKVEDLNLSFPELSYFIEDINTQNDLKGFRRDRLNLKGQAVGSLTELELKSFIASISESNFSIDGRISNLMEVEEIAFETLKVKLTSPHTDLRNFISDPAMQIQLQRFGTVEIDGTIDGEIDKFNIENLSLVTDGILQGNFTGVIKNTLDTENLSYQVHINDITTGSEDLRLFLDTIPVQLAKFDTLNYQGEVIGNLRDLTLQGGFETTLGQLITDLDIKFTEDYESANYKGKLDLRDFDLGKLLDSDSIGITSMHLEFDGAGLSLEDVETKLDAKVELFEFNRYQYRDFSIDGLFEENKFVGKANIKDENISFYFDGKIDLNDSIPAFAFDFVLDTINLEKLNLIDDTYHGKLEVNADFTGIELDKLNGKFTLYDIDFWNDDRQLLTDSVIIDASHVLSKRTLNVNSEYLEAHAKGDFDLSLLPEILLDFLEQYFPVREFVGLTENEEQRLRARGVFESSNDHVDLDAQLHKIDPIFEFFDIPASQMDSSLFRFSFDAGDNETSLLAYIPSVVYDGYFLDSIYAMASNDDQEVLKGIFSIDSVGISDEVNLSQVLLDFNLSDQKARFHGSIESKKDYEGLGFVGEIESAEEGDFAIKFVEDLILRNKPWQVKANEPILVKGSSINIPFMRVENGLESFTISGDNSELKLDFNTFDLLNIFEIVGIEDVDLKGSANGPVVIGMQDDLQLTGDLQVLGLEFNEFKMGNLEVSANKIGSETNALLRLVGDEADLDSKIKYDLDNGALSGTLDVNEMNVAPFEPFLEDYFANTTGALSGNFAITGNLDQPQIRGDIYFNDVSAFVKDLKTDYKIKSGSASISDALIKPNITLADEKDRLSYLTGSISHNLFEDFVLDLDFNAEAFTFLNSSKNSDDYYYGKFVGKVKADLTGDLELPIIDAEVTALKETDMTIQLLGSEAVLSEEDYIVFYDGSETYDDYGIDSLAKVSYNIQSAFDLNLTLNTTSEADFHVIIDPVTGDKLDINGSSSLLVKMPRNGDLSIVGEYVVSEGNYRVSYENTIRRNFTIQGDSKIVFQGDPFTALLDLETVYKTKVSTSPLTSTSSSISAESAGSGKQEVNVVLDIGGTISKPVLEFDIQAPEDDLSPIGSDVSNALSSLRQDETRLLEQVFSIILFNSFTGGSSGSNLNDIGTSTAISSVGNLINGQLSKLAKNATGLEIDFGLDQYRDDSELNSNITEIDVGLSQRLFDDRLIISAGGNANLETGSEQGSNFAGLAGDFVIQYILTKDGKYRVKVFQKSDFNALSNESIWKTGIGVTYKTRFGKIRPSKQEDED